MKRIRLIVQYDGTGYVGWQTQPNGVAVQAVLEKEIEKLSGKPAALHGSGRTDSGVHALAQVAHFDTESRIPSDKWAFALNAGLPPDIRVQFSDEAKPDFHARYDVKQKHYRYTIELGAHASAFRRNTALHYHGALDLGRMERAASQALGEHDFVAFKTAGTRLNSTVRTLYRSAWTRHGSLLYYDVAGSGFMYNMVRILVGTMLEIGGGLCDENAIKKAFDSGKREDAGATAPPQGLMLMRVQYPSFDTADFVEVNEV